MYLAEGGYLSPSFSPKALEPLNDSGDTVEELEEEYGSSGLPVEVMIGADHCTVQIYPRRRSGSWQTLPENRTLALTWKVWQTAQGSSPSRPHTVAGKGRAGPGERGGACPLFCPLVKRRKREKAGGGPGGTGKDGGAARNYLRTSLCAAIWIHRRRDFRIFQGAGTEKACFILSSVKRVLKSCLQKRKHCLWNWMPGREGGGRTERDRADHRSGEPAKGRGWRSRPLIDQRR